MPSDDEKRELKEKIDAFIRDRHAGGPFEGMTGAVH